MLGRQPDGAAKSSDEDAGREAILMSAVAPRSTGPLLISDAEIAARLGVQVRSIRTLREQGRLRAIKVAGKWMYPRDAADAFIREEMERADKCRDEIEDRASYSGANADSGTSAPTKPDVPDGKARAQRIAQRLKASSRSSFDERSDTVPRVIPKNSR